MVFAASVTDTETGYALTASQVREAAVAGGWPQQRGGHRRLRVLGDLSRETPERVRGGGSATALASWAWWMARSGARTFLTDRIPR